MEVRNALQWWLGPSIRCLRCKPRRQLRAVVSRQAQLHFAAVLQATTLVPWLLLLVVLTVYVKRFVCSGGRVWLQPR